jgi:hypothetical protein
LAEEKVETAVDDLIKLLKEKKKLGLSEAARAINMPVETVQAWVDFLVEEKIIGIEYKFTKPYIYLNEAKTRPKIITEEKPGLETFKEEFRNKALSNNLPAGKIDFLWKNHLNTTLEQEKAYFYKEAKKRNLDPDASWEKYKTTIIK